MTHTDTPAKPEFRFVRLSEVRTETICAVIYGAPNYGKTTLALTAAKPVLLDFDEGSQRAAHVGDPAVLVCRRWADLEGMQEADVADFGTIVVDTVGTALTKLSADLMRRDPALGRNGTLTLQGWGRLGGEFRAFLARMRSWGKDVVLIAHLKETEQDGKVTERIVASGQSRDEVYQQADIMGRIVLRPDPEHDGKTQRVLSFDFTSAAYAKNVGLSDYALAPPSESPDTLARIMHDAKSAMNGQSRKRRKIEKMKADIRAAKTAKDFTRAARKITKADAPRHWKQDLVERAKAAGFRWDREGGLFVPAKAEKPAPGEEPF